MSFVQLSYGQKNQRSMEIVNRNYSYAPNFGIAIARESVLEATSGCLFAHNGIDGFKEVFSALSGKNTPGHIGFRGYAIRLGEKINAKYPEIAKASSEIKNIVKNNLRPSCIEERQKINEIVGRFEPIIDITL